MLNRFSTRKTADKSGAFQFEGNSDKPASDGIQALRYIQDEETAEQDSFESSIQFLKLAFPAMIGNIVFIAQDVINLIFAS